MHRIKAALFASVLALALLGDVPLAASPPGASLAIPQGGLAATKSGNDLVLSFPTVHPNLYTVQRCPSFRQPWANSQWTVLGDGTVNRVTITNAILGGNGYFRLVIQAPTPLRLPQSLAFAVLGHSCGGIKEQAYVTGFDPTNGYPIGEVHLSTTCSTGGRGSPPATFTAWAAVTWDFAGNVVSSRAVSNGASVNPAFSAADRYQDTIYNAGAAAYLVVPFPDAPTGVTAVQAGDQLQVSWTPNAVNPAAVTSATLTAAPLNPTASPLTVTVTGSAPTGVIPSLQPQTTYRVTVVNTTLGGSSPASIPISVTTSPATVPPSAPTGVTASWTNLDPTNTTDTLAATWQAAVPGDSPIDQYRITIVGSDGAGTFSQTVSGVTLTASFAVDYVPNWSVRVQAHNAVGWGPSSTDFTLGGL